MTGEGFTVDGFGDYVIHHDNRRYLGKIGRHRLYDLRMLIRYYYFIMQLPQAILCKQPIPYLA